ncbi:MAG: inositol 2-dehydrogenase [Thermoproteales archaeon]|nr:inositol 2-dehydrogenase [Thermoproteales archaeon]
MGMIGVAVVGLGRIGRLHAEIFATKVEGAKLVAVCDVVKGVVEEVGSKLGVKPYTDYGELLRDRAVDAVVICTPTFLHAEMIVRAAEEGKHVLCEKPLAVTTEEAERALKSVEKSGVKLQVGYMRRFDQAYSGAKKAIEEGRIGRPLVFISIARDPGPPPGWAADPRKSGGIFLDMLSHDFDMARWLMSSEVRRVYATGGAYLYEELREKGDLDVVNVCLEFESGALGLIHGSRKSAFGYDLRTEVMGSEGTLYVGSHHDPNLAVGTRAGVTYSGVSWFMGRFYDAYVREDEEFVKSIAEDKEPLVTGLDGRRAIEIAEAAWRSVREGRPVSLV